MNPSQENRRIETLMANQPLYYKPEKELSESKDACCNTCYQGLRFAKDLFEQLVVDAVTEETIKHTLSLDIKHRPAPRNESINQAFPGKDGWQHIIQLFNYNRGSYVAYAGVTVVTRHKHHTSQCEYLTIVTDVHIRKNASSTHHAMINNMIRNLSQYARRFSGTGTTTIEKRVDDQGISYLIATHIGKIATPFVTPGSTIISNYLYNRFNDIKFKAQETDRHVRELAVPNPGSANPVRPVAPAMKSYYDSSREAQNFSALSEYVEAIKLDPEYMTGRYNRDECYDINRK